MTTYADIRDFPPLGAVIDSISTKPSSKDWSSRVMSSTPDHVALSSNRFSALATDDDRESTDDFSTVLSRSSLRKRKRDVAKSKQLLSGTKVIVSDGVANVTVNKERSKLPKRGPLIVGRMSSASQFSMHSSITAARIIKKAVFCIDNVDSSYSEEEVSDFVSSLGIKVLSCYSVQPRRRRFNTDYDEVSRKAFRLCIPDSDSANLLDASKWPDGVSVYEWYFKPKIQQSNDKRLRLDDLIQISPRKASSPAVAPAKGDQLTEAIVHNLDDRSTTQQPINDQDTSSAQKLQQQHLDSSDDMEVTVILTDEVVSGENNQRDTDQLNIR
jgi:hypothetical protein